MKKFKKMMALVLSMVMVLAMGVTAFAGTITVDNVKKDEEYTAYKILNYKSADTNDDGTKDAYTYYLTAEQYENGLGELLRAVGFEFTASADSTQYYVSNTESLNKEGESKAKDIALELNTEKNLQTLQTVAIKKSDPQTANSDADKDGYVTAQFENLEPGYWFVTSSMGSLCSLQSYDDQAIVVEKNTIPTEDKKQSTTENGEYIDGEINVSVGDKVYYEITVIDGSGTDQAIKITDTMSEGLTNNRDYVLYKNEVGEGNRLIADTDYEVSEEGNQSFIITISASYVKSLEAGEKVIIRYSATLNASAVTKGEEESNNNKAELDYSHQHQEDTVEVTTYKFQVVKDDKDGKLLTGAKFRLYDAQEGGNEIPLKKISIEGIEYYVVNDAEDAVGVDIEAGTPIIRGLKEGEYWLEETEAPEGYNKLDKRAEVTVTKDDDNLAEIDTVNKIYTRGGIEVENNTGSILPSTGGIGTTIFYVIGAILVIGAGVLLVTRRRMKSE